MSRPELLSEHNYRSDGRKPTELRSLSLSLSPHLQADGSALVSHGLTKVMVTVYGPREARLRSNTAHDHAVLSVQIDIPAFSGGTNTGSKRSRGDKRTLEFAANIKSTFEPVIQTHLYPRTEISINIQVLQSDGSLLQTAINATNLALIDAGIPLSDYVCAITCALHDATPLLDLTSLEESDLPCITVAFLPKSGRVTLATLETQVAVERFDEMMRLTGDAAKVIHVEMVRAVKTRTERLVRAMEGAASGGSTSRAIELDDTEMRDT